MPNESTAIATFIARWQHADGSELANAQTFVRELCELLGLPVPDPARADTADNAYVFARRIVFRHGDGGASEGRIDCYQSGGARSFDDALMRAFGVKLHAEMAHA